MKKKDKILNVMDVYLQVLFNNLDMEPYWDPHIYRTEQYRALKMMITK